MEIGQALHVVLASPHADGLAKPPLVAVPGRPGLPARFWVLDLASLQFPQ